MWLLGETMFVTFPESKPGNGADFPRRPALGIPQGSLMGRKYVEAPSFEPRSALVLPMVLVLFLIQGCQGFGGGKDASAKSRKSKAAGPPVEKVIQVFAQRPWLNLDASGDRDPEGVGYRVFLDAGKGSGILADGTFHVEMYQLSKDSEGKIQRTLVSDWHYPTSDVATIAQPGMLGQGYFLRLRWSSKEIAGTEVELITRFEDQLGRSARSATKRLRVPKYVN